MIFFKLDLKPGEEIYYSYTKDYKNIIREKR